MKKIKITEPLVSVNWLDNNLGASNLVVINATIPKVTGAGVSINEGQIPTTRFFDLKNKFSDVTATFPTTFPSEEQFTKSAQELGINADSAIVIYDDQGIYSSPRAWWLFKAFGHDNVAVLDGGFPAWKKANLKVEEMHDHKFEKGDFKAKYHPELMKFFADMKKNVQNKDYLVIDARSEARFKCLEPEPRSGLRMGTIPNSINIPFENLLVNDCFKNKEDLLAIFNRVAKKEDQITFSCGSGITACVLALGAELAGFKNLSVYDGSWTEWGSLVD